MSMVLELPILGLDEAFPDKLYILHHVPSKRYGCFCHQGVHGLACFSTESGAFRFGELIDLGGMETIELSFDEARQVAKDRPMPVVSLMLLDEINDPKIHYVR
ncbi:MAG: hypothetical protein ACHQ50_13515 [Fimbriimonadales bacterium]